MKFNEKLVHIFPFDEERIMLDINTGLVHSLDQMTYAFTELWRESKKELAEVPALAAELSCGRPVPGGRSLGEESRRLLAQADPGELEEIREALEELIASGSLLAEAPELESFTMPEDHVVKALCLHVAHDCNLRCRYCFAGTGAFGGDRSLMSLEVGKQALDFLFEASGKRRHIEVDYFGGEPLMNFQVVKELIRYGRQESRRRGKVLKQTLTTNGVLLEGEILDFLNQEEVALVLSLDGRKEVNDSMRPSVNGKGSYDVILPHFKAAVASRDWDNYYLRGTFTRYNKDFFEDIKHMIEEGFSLVSEEPVVADPGQSYAFREEDLPELYRQYEKLARYYVEKERAGEPFLFFHFNLDLDRGPCLPKRLSGCGAGHEYMAVAPEGTLYPCHQFVGNPDFVLGNVKEGVKRPEIGLSFRHSHVLTKEKCRDCWARFYCSGGCHANAWNFNKDLHRPYDLGCELEKKRLECALWIKVKEAEI